MPKDQFLVTRTSNTILAFKPTFSLMTWEGNTGGLYVNSTLSEIAQVSLPFSKRFCAKIRSRAYSRLSWKSSYSLKSRHMALTLTGSCCRAEPWVRLCAQSEQCGLIHSSSLSYWVYRNATWKCMLCAAGLSADGKGDLRAPRSHHSRLGGDLMRGASHTLG